MGKKESSARDRADVIARIFGAIVFVAGSTSLALAPVPPQRAPFSLVNTVLANRPAVILMRLGLAALAAFVVAAFVQRLLLARFDLKVGPGGLELEPLEIIGDRTEARLAELEESVRGIEDVLHHIDRRPGGG